MKIDEILLKLFDIGAIKCGSFTLKSGILSPIYIDLRESISYPTLLIAISEALWQVIKTAQFDRICGVPYTALPIASYLSCTYNLPMVMRRKEQKDYGTKKMIEGVYTQGQVCLILEDLITSGASIFETIGPIEQVGMRVQDVGVFLDREQGGRQRLEDKGYRLHAVTTLTALLNTLHHHQRIDYSTRQQILHFIQGGTHV